jgi:hypothetical protein
MFRPEQFVLDAFNAFGVLDARHAAALARKAGLSPLPRRRDPRMGYWRLDALLVWMRANELPSLPNLSLLASRRLAVDAAHQR